MHIEGEHRQDRERSRAVEPGRELVNSACSERGVERAEAEHRCVAQPEGQSGDEAELGDIGGGQPPAGIDAVAHGAPSEDACAHIVADRIAAEASERGRPIRHITSSYGAEREQVVERQREIAARHVQRWSMKSASRCWRARRPLRRHR